MTWMAMAFVATLAAGPERPKPQPWLEVRHEGKVGFIDRTGKVMLSIKYDEVNGYDSTGGYRADEVASIDFSEGLRPVKLGGKWGYIDPGEVFAIEPQYEMAGPFGGDMAQVKIDGKWGVIDRRGKMVVPAKYTVIGRFSGGVARVAVGGRLLEGGWPGAKWGAIDANGKEVVPATYDNALEAMNGRVALATGGGWQGKGGGGYSGGKWEAFDAAGRKNDQPAFDLPVVAGRSGARGGVLAFAEGLAPVMVEGRLGYLDEKLQFAIKPTLQSAGPFSEGLAAARVDGKQAYIDRTGQPVVTVDADYLGQFRNGLALAGKDGKLGLIDRTGKWIVEPKYDRIDVTDASDVAVVISGRKYGLVSKAGKVLCEPRYDWLHFGTRERGLVVNYMFVGGPQLVGVIDANGTLLAEPLYGRALSVDAIEKWAITPKQEGTLWGFADATGKLVIPAQFNKIEPADFGLVRVNKPLRTDVPGGVGMSWGLVDTVAGKVVVPPGFQQIKNFREGLAAAQGKCQGPWGYIDRAGRWIIKPQFHRAGDFDGGVAWVYQAGAPVVGYIDRAGDQLWTPQKGTQRVRDR